MADGGWDGSAGSRGRAPYPAQGPYEPGESSLPWQDRERYPSFMGALWETLKLVLFEPSKAFSQIKAEGSLAGSMLYILILGSAGGYIGLAWQLLWRGLGVTLGAAAHGEADMVVAVGGMTIFALLAALLIPISVLIGSFIGSAVLHVCLWIVGGANRSFEATYAVIAYCGGSTSLFSLVPFCGGLIGVVWNIVIEIIGLREAHGTTTGRAALAVFLPLIVCCGLSIVVAVIVLLVASGAAGQ